MAIPVSNENKENKQRIVTLLIEAMKSTQISPEVYRINEAIREMRLHHTFSPFAAQLGLGS